MKKKKRREERALATAYKKRDRNCSCAYCFRYVAERKRANSLRPSKYPVHLKAGRHYTESYKYEGREHETE